MQGTMRPQGEVTRPAGAAAPRADAPTGPRKGAARPTAKAAAKTKAKARSGDKGRSGAKKPARAARSRSSVINPLRVVGVVLAIAGLAAVCMTILELLRGFGPSNLNGLLVRLIPGPLALLVGLFLIERSRLGSPAGAVEESVLGSVDEALPVDTEGWPVTEPDVDDGHVYAPVSATAYWGLAGNGVQVSAPPAHPMLLPPPMPGTQIVEVDEEGASTADPTTAWLASLADPAQPIGTPAASAMTAIQLPTGQVPVVAAAEPAPVAPAPAVAAAPAPVAAPEVPVVTRPPAPAAPPAQAAIAPDAIVPTPTPVPAPLPMPPTATPASATNGTGPTGNGTTGGAVAVNGSSLDALGNDPRQAAASTTAVVRNTDPAILENYRGWVLAQATGADRFVPLDVHGPLEPWFLLSACGVATLLAWTHEDHGATYSVETWVDDIIPHQGIAVSDRQLAIELLVAAALHAGGIHTEPTARLLAYDPADLVTAMGALHVGLIRLYCGLERISPARVLRDQFGLDSAALAAPPTAR